MKITVARLTLFCLSLTIISLMIAFQSVAKVDLKSAAGVWLFDEGSGDVAKDYSENGNDGILRNGPKWVDGKFGKALEFNGISSYVEVSAPKGLPAGSSARTISLFFKWSEVKWPSPGVEIMGYGTNANSQRLGIWIDSSHGLGIETCNYGRVFDWNGDTDWHHLAVVYPEGEKSTDKFILYFDGALKPGRDVGTGIQTLNTSDAPLAIGVLPTPTVYYFNGIIDDVGIFSEVLSEDDIKGISKGGLLSPSLAVSPSDKMAVSWGRIKAQ